jgi:hypothetical protein
MTRTEILTRYRRLRQISNEHHHYVLDVVANDVMLDCAKRLGLKTNGKSIIHCSKNEMILVEDAATYLPRPGRSSPIDRYARSAGFADGSDEALVLDAMRNARFSFWRVERRHETAGLILRDLLRDEETWLVDESMEEFASPGYEIAARLVQPEGFAINARITVPIVAELLEEVRARGQALLQMQNHILASDPRLVVTIYRAAVAIGLMDSVLMVD